MTTLFLRFSFSLCFVLMVYLVNAQGDLLITPKRLVFDGSKRTEEVNLANIGKDTATYSISFTQFKMDDKGSFIPVGEDDSTQKFAHKNLRFFPRTVTLAPNEAQSVKVQLIRANELLPGEYRSHLFFKNVLNKTALGEEETSVVKDSGISVNLKPAFGISLATIVRVGQTKAEATLSDARLVTGSNPTASALNITLNRSGNSSLYGDLQVNYIGPDEKSTQVAIMRGIAVYTPNSHRLVTLPLKLLPGLDYTTGNLEIEYVDSAIKNAIIATAKLAL